MKHKKAYGFFVLLVIVSMLVGCTSPIPGPEQPDVPVLVPTGTIEPYPHPEPPVLVVALPIEYSQLLAKYGPYEVASTDASFARVPQDCANLFSHGLRAKRLADFASFGISVAALFEAISKGSAVIERAGISEANGTSLGVLISFGTYKVFMIFGNISKPTIYPLPWVSKGETMAQAMENIFGPSGQFRRAVDVTVELTNSVKQLAGCVNGLIKKNRIDTVTPEAAAPGAIPAPEPIPMPAETPVVPVPEGALVDVSSSFATTNLDLLQFDSAEIELLIILGVVVIVGAVAIACVTTGCLAAIPLVALA